MSRFIRSDVRVTLRPGGNAPAQSTSSRPVANETRPAGLISSVGASGMRAMGRMAGSSSSTMSGSVSLALVGGTNAGR